MTYYYEVWYYTDRNPEDGQVCFVCAESRNEAKSKFHHKFPNRYVYSIHKAETLL